MELTPSSKISEIVRITKDQSVALARLGISNLGDLLHHYPTRYGNFAEGENIAMAPRGSEVSLIGRLEKLQTTKSWKTKIPMTKGIFVDTNGKSLPVIWMHQPYIGNLLKGADTVKIVGTISDKGDKPVMMNPRVEKLKEFPIDHGNSLFNKNEQLQPEPVYPETKGVSSAWVYHTLERVFGAKIHEQLVDPIPKELLTSLKLPPLATALMWIHRPKNSNDAQVARKRFAFQEIFLVQVARQMVRRQLMISGAIAVPVDESNLQNFWKHLGFTPTGAQKNAIHTIVGDISKAVPMLRLVEGDVGSGKTAVAAGVCYALAEVALHTKTCYQVAYLAPTEVLANQLFESFIQFFKHQPLPIALLTGKTCKKFPSKVDPTGWTTTSKSQLIKWMQSGDIVVTIGTHALLGEKVGFKNLALAIIDEQHRFGTNQRAKVVNKGTLVPHLLSMTATPIPRTLALTIYGDLDLTVLDELPPGRKIPLSKVVTFTELKPIWEHIKKELAAGRQAYLICPRIADNEEGMPLISTTQAQTLLKKNLPGVSSELMHSKLTKQKKEDVMKDFADKKFDVLISTSVVEVGVNVPNATSIVIFNAERYGLAQLHQLRGRVQRSSDQSYCFLVSNSQSETSIKRLQTLASTSDGFALAEADLNVRGTGDLAGVKQWGLSDIAMEALRNPKLVSIARESALGILDNDPQLTKNPNIKNAIVSGGYDIHFE